MYKYIILILALSSCSRSNFSGSNSSTEQIFISDQRSGKPGKCYSKSKFENQLKWVEIICSGNISKKIISQIHHDLIRRNYAIDNEDIVKAKLGETTRRGIVQFQKNQGMAFGPLDWATVNRLKLE